MDQQPQASFSKSQLFAIYNKARKAARQGKLDLGRLNRALGILQSYEGPARMARYQARISACACPDAKRGQICKHRISAMIIRRAAELH